MVVAVLMAGPVAAQERAALPESPAAAGQTPDYGTSLDRVREGLQRPETPILSGLDRRADFRLEIREEQKMEEILKRLEVKSGPVPAGGLYMYEQNRMLFNPVDRPLMQPYAAFSGGELITIAIENLLGRYVAKPLLDSYSNSRRSAAQEAAHQEYLRTVGEYCNSRPDYMDLKLCNPDAR